MFNVRYEKDRALVVAVEDSQLDQVKKILENLQGDINAVEDKFGTPLIVIAAKRNDFSMLKLLEAKGASVLASDPIGYTALDWAKRNSNAQMAEFIKSKVEKRRDLVM